MGKFSVFTLDGSRLVNKYLVLQLILGIGGMVVILTFMLNISDMLCTISECRTSFQATSSATSAGCLSWLPVGVQKIVLHELLKQFVVK